MEEEVAEAPSNIILSDQLIDHLAFPESAMKLYKERLSEDFLVKDEELAKDVLKFVFKFIDEYGEAPTTEVVKDEFIKWPFAKPLCPTDYLVNRLRERHLRNRLQPALLEVSRMVAKDPQGAVAQGTSLFYDLGNKTQSRRNVLDVDDWDVFMAEYRQQLKDGMFNGVTFGWDAIDQILGGLRNGLHYVLGRPKRYKSWFLLKSAVEAYRIEQRNILFASLELPEDEMMKRFVCMMANVSWDRMYKGYLLPEDYRAIDKVKEELSSWEHTFTITHPPVVERNAPMLLQNAKEKNAEILYIDQMKYIDMAGSHRYDKRWEKVEYICEELKLASDALPIYVAAQFNREAANLTEMADLSKIGLSDAIGQHADTLMGLYQNKEMRSNKFVEFGVVDSRNTEHASFLLDVQLTENCDFEFVERKVE